MRNVPLQWMVPLRPDGEDETQKCANCQQVGLRDINTESSPPTWLSIDDGARGKFKRESRFPSKRVGEMNKNVWRGRG